MDTKHLSYFKVENFKRFDSLEVKDIGQFNLIVGDNNVGKTTLLEALLFDDVDNNAFLRNLAYSLFAKSILQSNVANYNFFDFFPLEKNKAIQYNFKFDGRPIQSVSVAKKLFSQIEDRYIKDLQRYFLINQSGINGKLDFAIEFDNGHEKSHSFTSQVPLSFYYGSLSPLSISVPPYISFNSIYDRDMALFYDHISIDSKKLENLKTHLKIFIPLLTSIEANSAIVPEQNIIALREEGKNLIPLSQYGDGTIKLFRYLLNMEYCEGRRLMIDEIDAGIHYSRMKDFIKNILSVAKSKGIQIFGTTHSKECIEYYKQALEELGYENDGRIIRIADTKSGIRSYTMNYVQFENSLFAESEIR